MKIKFITTETAPGGYTTVGYWRFTQPENKGELHIEVAKLPDRRFWIAVAGHELIEALWCKLRGITTETCDAFDDWAEGQYQLGNWPKTFEAGFYKTCPYKVGHVMGSYWERIIITLTGASWQTYDRACNDVMKIPNQ